MSDNYDIEELLKKHLTNASEPGPLSLFDQIETEILEKKKRKKRFFFWLWTLGIGMCLGTTLILFNISGENQNQTVENGKPKTDLELRKGLSENSIEPNLTPGTITEDTIHHQPTLTIEKSQPNEVLLSEGNDQEEENTLLASTTPGGNSIVEEIDPESGITSPEVSTNETLNNATDEGWNTTENNEANTTITDPSNDVTRNTITPTIPVDTSTITTNDLSSLTSTAHETADTSETTIENNQTKTIDTDSNTFENQSTVDVSTDTDTSLLTLNTTIDSSTAETDSTDTVENNPPKTDTTQNPKVASKKYGITVFGGPTAFDIALFKPYFSSGLLSNRSFSSSGFELGIGVQRNLGQRFKLQVMGAYNQKQTNFTYNLMIGESDFFNLYEENELIPVENLDDPNSCNCFLAEDASLNYKLSALYLSIGTSFDIVQTAKHRFGPQLEFSGNLSNSFKMISAGVLAFPEDQKEQFSSLRLGLGLAYNYGITNRFYLGLRPTYYYQFGNKSTLLAAPLRELTIPFTATFLF